MHREPTKSNLQHKSSTEQAFRSGPDASRSVLSLGTTAPRPESHGKSGAADRAQPITGSADWWADLEFVWRKRTADARELLEVRAKRRTKQAREAPADCPRLRVAAARSAEWADHRARAIALARADVLDSCGKRWRQVRCGCSRFEMKVGCDQPQLCARCRKLHSRKWRVRIVQGMDAALRDARAAWHATPSYRRRGMRPGIYLITVTAPHSGDLVTDRESMGAAVRKLLKHAEKYEWWSTYALTWEATAGTAGDGHMHCHIAVVSSWIPYTSANVETDNSLAWAPRRRGERKRKSMRGLHEVWSDAAPGSIQPDVQAPRIGSDAASTAGYYLAKYVTKGVDAAEFTGRKAGELLVALRGRRKVSTSARFWIRDEKRCGHCEERYQAVGSPCALQDIMPGAVLRSMAERAGWFIPRGSVQIELRGSGDDDPMAMHPGARRGWVSDARLSADDVRRGR